MEYKIKTPQELKARVMLWTDVSFHDMDAIDKTLSIPDLERVLCRVLKIDLPEPKREVLLELYVQAVIFSRKLNFKREQTSAFLSILKSIHEANVYTPFNNVELCLQYNKDLLLCHSVRRPPFSVDIFNFEQVDRILKYIYENYLRHYKLYKYIFTPQIKLDLTLTYPGIPETQATDASAGNQNEDGLDEMDETAAEYLDNIAVSVSDLKTLITHEVKHQMKVVSGQLDQTIKEKLAQQSLELGVAPSRNKAKK